MNISTIEKLVNELRENGLLKTLSLGDEDIADAIFLALTIGQEESKVRGEKNQEKNQNQNNKIPTKTEIINQDEIIDDNQNKQQKKQDPSLYTDDANNLEKDTENKEDTKTKGFPFQTPSAPALLNKLALNRALRPLMVNVPSPTRKVIDTEATVTRIAEQDIWLPVTQAEGERWLDLELIIEENYSSFIWENTIEELQELLHHHGAFRRFRTWTLSHPEKREPSDNRKEPILTRRHKGKINYQCEHSYRELIASNGRSLIILVSDCVSSIWQEKYIYQWLEKWAKKSPVAILQLFPERLWLSTELGFGYQVKFNALNAGVNNSQLNFNDEFDAQRTLNLPIITLEPEYIKNWAKVITGYGSNRTPGIVLDLDFVFEQIKAPSTSQPQNDSGENTPENIVDRFLATASPTAQKLAGLMSAAPVSLPVVHLIQKNFEKTLLPQSTPVHISEVFLSGMIERKKEKHKDFHLTEILQSKNEVKQPQYDFIPGVRKILNQAMPIGETEKVLDVLSLYIAKKLELGDYFKSFTALLLKQQELSLEKQEKILPFAHVTVEVLGNLGGEYAEFAQKLRFSDSVSPFNPEETSSQPELKEDCTFTVATIEIIETHTFNFTVATIEKQTKRRLLGLLPGQEKWVIKQRQQQAEGIIEELGEGISLELMEIPGGTFWMGTDDEEIERLVKKFQWEGFRREKPQHLVTLQPFSLGRYPITQGQWKAIASRTDLQVNPDITLDPDPSRFKDDPLQPPLQEAEREKTRWDRPVEQVNWYQAKEFCARLSKLTGKEYRLPTEAEWEYACRAVINDHSSAESEDLTQAQWNQKYQQPFHFGDTITGDLANYDAAYTYGDEPKGEFRSQTTPVGYFGVANAFGLYDMHGNVWEWCEDNYHENYEGAPNYGSAWIKPQNSNPDNQSYSQEDEENKPYKVIRGGSWDSLPNGCRCAYRNYNDPRVYSTFVGFRVVCAPPRTS